MKVLRLLALSTILLMVACTTTPTTDELDISGTWTGIITSGADEYFYSWDINQNQENTTGVITIAFKDKSLLSTHDFVGTFKDNTLAFEGTKFINLADGAGWCLTKGTLTYMSTDGKETFDGSWGPHAIPSGCADGFSGSIKLEKE